MLLLVVDGRISAVRGGQLRKAQMLAGAVIVGVRKFSVFRAVACKSDAQSIAEMPAARKSCYHCGNHRPALRWASVCSLKSSGGRCNGSALLFLHGAVSGHRIQTKVSWQRDADGKPFFIMLYCT